MGEYRGLELQRESHRLLGAEWVRVFVYDIDR